MAKTALLHITPIPEVFRPSARQRDKQAMETASSENTE